MKNYKDYIIKKLKRFKEEDLIIDPHAEKRARQRNVDIDEVKANLLNPSERLAFANKVGSEHDKLEKFKCYFAFSKTQVQLYIIKFNGKVIIKTIIKINKRWQKRAEKYGKV